MSILKNSTNNGLPGVVFIKQDTNDTWYVYFLFKSTCRYLSLTPCGVGKLFLLFMGRGHIRKTAGCLLISTINQLLQIIERVEM